jgi:putative DNA primase/helicase
MMDAAEIARGLHKAHKNGKGWKACCPGHDDHEPSLDIDDAADGKVLVKCRAGCKQEDVVAALKGLGLWPEALKNGHDKPKRRVVATYDYHDAAGEVVYQVVRFEPKDFRQRRPDPARKGEWLWNMNGVSPVPYRLPRLLVSGACATIICEGEKDADAVGRLGLVTTTNHGGAGKWRPDLNRWFKSRTVFILPHNDKAGRDHAEHVAGNLHGLAASVHVVELPGLGEKGDAFDWIKAGGTSEALQKLCKAAPAWQPKPAAETTSQGTARFKTYHLGEFSDMPLPARSMIMAPILPSQGLAMAFAPRGIGKTHLALNVAYSVAEGGSFLRWHAPEPRKVLLVDGEMPGAALQERLKAIQAASPPIHADENFRLLPMDLQELGASLNLSLEEDQRAIEAEIQDAALLVLDNLSTLVNGGRENDADSWDAMQSWLLKLRRQGLAVLFVHHAGRGEHARGTSKREDVLDTVIRLTRPDDYEPEDGARFEVHLTKARGVFGEDAAPFEAKLETRDGAAFWTTKTLVDAMVEQVAEMTKGGMTVRDIASDLGLSRAKANRIQQRLRDEGRL